MHVYSYIGDLRTVTGWFTDKLRLTPHSLKPRRLS